VDFPVLAKQKAGMSTYEPGDIHQNQLQKPANGDFKVQSMVFIHSFFWGVVQCEMSVV